MFYINDGEVDLMIEGTSADRCTHFKTLKVTKQIRIHLFQLLIINNSLLY